MPFTIDIRVAGLQSLKVACNVSIVSSQRYVLSDNGNASKTHTILANISRRSKKGPQP